MKKYLTFLVVLSMVLIINVQSIRAEDIAVDIEEGGSVNTRTNLTPLQKRQNLEAQMKAHAELRLKQGEMRTAIKADREKLQTEIKTKREEIKKENDTLRADVKAKIDALRAGIKLEKDATKAKIKEARLVVRENVMKRFDGAILKISNLKDRVSAQITKLKAKGVDVVNAENFVATAEVKLSEADTKIAEANAILSISIDELTAENRAEFKALVKDIETLIKDAHKSLNDAIKSLKGEVRLKMEARAKTNAETSTATETNQ